MELVGRLRNGPAAVALEGEAGIGKTTLAQACVAAAEERGFLVLGLLPRSARLHVPITMLR